MLTSTIEPGTYMVGTKIFKPGQEVPFTEEEQKEMDAICDIYENWNVTRSALLNACHLAEEPFDIELAKQAHDLKIENFKLRFKLNLLIAGVEKRLGGLLPIYFSSLKKKLFVNAKPEESLVYTIKFIGDTIGMPAFDFPRAVASQIVGKPQVSFNNMEDERLSIISVFGKGPGGGTLEKAENRLSTLGQAVEAALEEEGPTAMSLIILWFANDDIRVINADAIPSTIDPTTRVLWNLKDILPATKPNGISIVIEKAEPTRMSFAVSHLDKGKPATGLEITHTVAPVRETKVNTDAKPNFGVTRLTPEAIDALLE